MWAICVFAWWTVESVCECVCCVEECELSLWPLLVCEFVVIVSSCEPVSTIFVHYHHRCVSPPSDTFFKNYVLRAVRFECTCNVWNVSYRLNNAGGCSLAPQCVLRCVIKLKCVSRNCVVLHIHSLLIQRTLTSIASSNDSLRWWSCIRNNRVYSIFVWILVSTPPITFSHRETNRTAGDELESPTQTYKCTHTDTRWMRALFISDIANGGWMRRVPVRVWMWICLLNRASLRVTIHVFIAFIGVFRNTHTHTLVFGNANTEHSLQSP